MQALAEGFRRLGSKDDYALNAIIELDKALRKLALDDEDLKPLWDWTRRWSRRLRRTSRHFKMAVQVGTDSLRGV